MRNLQNFWPEDFNDNLEDLHIDGVIVLKLILDEFGGRVWPDFVRFRMWPLVGLCEYGNELSGFDGEIFTSWNQELLKGSSYMELAQH